MNNNKFDVNSLWRKSGKIIVVLQSQDQFIGKEGPTYSFQLYNMFYGPESNKVSGTHIARQEQILRACERTTSTYSVPADKFSRKLLEFVNTDVPVHVIIDSYGVWHYTDK